MELQHFNVKIFVDGEVPVSGEDFINVFHRWTAEQSMPEMMIDVADYRHVPNGPGVVMVGHEADYYMDHTDGRPGLRYSCKVAQDGSNSDRFRHALESAKTTCGRLETEFPNLKFSRDQIQITINDRAFAPNTPETQTQLKSDLPTVITDVLSDSSADIQYEQDERRLAGQW